MRRAFVLRINPDWEPDLPLCGRVEHVASGATSSFDTLEDLAAFIAEAMERERDSEDSEGVE